MVRSIKGISDIKSVGFGEELILDIYPDPPVPEGQSSEISEKEFTKFNSDMQKALKLRDQILDKIQSKFSKQTDSDTDKDKSNNGVKK